MHPQWRLEPKFHPKRQADDNSTQNHNDPDGPRVAGIGIPKPKTAYRTRGPKRQQVLEYPTLTASGAEAPQGCPKDRNPLLRHKR